MRDLTELSCSGPGMHRLPDTKDLVEPCPTCGRHHFYGTTDRIQDSLLFVIYAPVRSLVTRLMRLVCRWRGHRWGRYERHRWGHVRRCSRCGIGHLAVPKSVGNLGEPYRW